MKDYVDAKTVAAKLGKSTKTVCEWARLGRIPSYRIGKKGVLFVLSEVEQCIVERKPRKHTPSELIIDPRTLTP